MPSTFQDLLEELRRLLEGNKDNVDANYPPTLTGANATSFTDNSDESETTANTALGYPFLSGITPVAQSKPSGTTWANWYFNMADNAYSLYQTGTHSPAEKQVIADNLYTIESDMATYVAEYT